MNYGLEAKPCGSTYTNPPLTNRLRDEKKQLEKRLSDVNKALELLESNQELANALDAISKLY